MNHYKITLSDLDGFSHTEIIEASNLDLAIRKAHDKARKYLPECTCTSGQMLTERESLEYLADQEAIRIQYQSEREFV